MYKNILVAIDLSSDTKSVVDNALRMAGNDPSKLNLIHVVEPVAGAYSMDIYALNIGELQQEAIAFAEQRIKALGEGLGIAAERTHTLLGAAASEIRSLASEINADAIVIGSHGHSGWKILLGSTAIKVLHGATCDVLTVYVGDDTD
ncbi:MAG: universal stress protein A [Pseudohongiellaceae bacterium]|jgi:universal stress protein A